MTTILPTEMVAAQPAQYNLLSSASTPIYLQVHAMHAPNTALIAHQIPVAPSANLLQLVPPMQPVNFVQLIAPLCQIVPYVQYQIQLPHAIVV